MVMLLTVPAGTEGQRNELMDPAGQTPVQAQQQDSSLIALSAPLSTVRYADGGTLVPLAQQNGSQDAPYSTVQVAVDNCPIGGAVIVAPGTYDEAVSVTQFVRIESMFPSQAQGAPVVITSITITGTAALDLVGVRVTTLTGANSTAIGVFQGTVTTLDCPLAAVTGRGSTFGALTALFIFTSDDCSHTGLITLNSTTATSTFSNGCVFNSSANIVGGGGTCVVLLDAESMFRFKNAGRTFTTVGRVGVNIALARATISVTPPALAAGAIGEAAAVSTVATELEGLGTLSMISVQKSGALAGGGALIGWRISASNSVVLQFLGPTNATAQNFFFTKLTLNT